MGILNLNRNYKIEVDGLEFELKIPTPNQIADIDIRVAKRMDGARLESFPQFTYEYLQMIETLNAVITKYPPELSTMRSWGEIDDFEFLEEVFTNYNKKKELFEEELKKNRDLRRTLANRNSSGSVSNETLPPIPQGNQQSGGLGAQAETIHTGSGFVAGSGQNQETIGIQQGYSSGTVQTSGSVHAGISSEGPASRRVL